MSFNPKNLKDDRRVCLNCKHFNTETGYAECHNDDNYTIDAVDTTESRGCIDLYDVCDNWESGK